MPTLIAVFILHLLVGSILGFCTIAISLQEKYFDLPSQKPANRPLWG